MNTVHLMDWTFTALINSNKLVKSIKKNHAGQEEKCLVSPEMSLSIARESLGWDRETQGVHCVVFK